MLHWGRGTRPPHTAPTPHMALPHMRMAPSLTRGCSRIRLGNRGRRGIRYIQVETDMLQGLQCPVIIRQVAALWPICSTDADNIHSSTLALRSIRSNSAISSINAQHMRAPPSSTFLYTRSTCMPQPLPDFGEGLRHDLTDSDCGRNCGLLWAE